MILWLMDEHNLQDEAIKYIQAIYADIGFKPPPKQFTVLASFYLYRPATSTQSSEIKVISLSTGTKCTPAIRYSPRGELLHDTHAEVLARRGAVRWFLEEIKRMRTLGNYTSDWLVLVPTNLEDLDSSTYSNEEKLLSYRLKQEATLHMYISTLPCGDASMGFLASTQDATMASLKSQSSHFFPKLNPHEASRGRDDYSRLGVLRTKPGRADSSPALSMSCSDKIAKWSVVGILGGFGTKFLEPVYVSSVVIGEIPLGDEEADVIIRDVMKKDCERALKSRIGNVQGLPNGYSVHHPAILFSNLPFSHSKTELDKVTRTTGSCNESLCWVADSQKPQVLINGLKRSTPPKYRYVKQYRPLLSRLSLFELCWSISETNESPTLPCGPAYSTAKQSSARYQRAKNALIGPEGPFSGWIRIESQYQHFDLNGTQIQWMINILRSRAIPTKHG